MKNRLLSVCALILLLFPLCARAEEQPVIINLVEDASQDYRFEEGAPLLETPSFPASSPPTAPFCALRIRS